MGIYLPTLSFLIAPGEVPKTAPETYNNIIPLLEKYHDTDTFYQCATKGYHHLELFRRMAEDFGMPNMDFYQQECNILAPPACPVLLDGLKEVERFILEDSPKLTEHLIKEERHIQEVIGKSSELNEKTKQRYRHEAEEKIRHLRNQSFSLRYKKATVEKNISQYGNKFGTYANNEYTVVLYWLKAQVHLLQKAVADKKAMVHVWIAP